MIDKELISWIERNCGTDMKLLLLLLVIVQLTRAFHYKNVSGVQCFEWYYGGYLCFQHSAENREKGMWTHAKPLMYELKNKKFDYSMRGGDCKRIYDNYFEYNYLYQGSCGEGSTCLGWQHRWNNPKWKDTECASLFLSNCKGADPEDDVNKGERISRMISVSKKCSDFFTVTDHSR
ncbi:hypothetical protein HDE_13920 [Halotydeus destructor]|nr:hypothetical protein HDE_13920 [Halotydeus destructor]